MSIPKFIWNLELTKKVKVKEIREYNIVKETSEDMTEYYVDAYGFFGGNVRLFKGSKEECVEFIDSFTEGNICKQRKDTEDNSLD